MFYINVFEERKGSWQPRFQFSTRKVFETLNKLKSGANIFSQKPNPIFPEYQKLETGIVQMPLCGELDFVCESNKSSYVHLSICIRK